MYQELALGCGSVNLGEKVATKTGCPIKFQNPITVDINPDRKPDLVWDLNNLPLPFDDAMFDEVHAYHVLEHLGTQGDINSFFGFFNEMYRILKPDGGFFAITPHASSPWALGDPGHTRIIHPLNLLFLQQHFYSQCDDNPESPASDYRYIYKGNFEIMLIKETDNGKDECKNNFFILRKI